MNTAMTGEMGSLALDRDDCDSNELEHLFFSAGLSQDQLQAASEREQEAALLDAGARRGQKVLFGVAGAATLGLMAAGLLVRGPLQVAAPAAAAVMSAVTPVA